MTVKIPSIGSKGLEGYRVQVQVQDNTDESTWQAITLRREEHLNEKIIAEKNHAGCMKDGV